MTLRAQPMPDTIVSSARSNPRAMFRRISVIAVALAAVHCAPAPAQSDINVACHKQDKAGDSADLTLNYAGGAKGTLKVSGVLGAMELPATRTDRKSTVQGEEFNIVGIEARGPALVPMPDKAALETCLKNKKTDPGDASTVAYHLHLCKQEVASGKEPVAIDASVVIVIDEPDAQVHITRTFRDESAAAGGRMMIEVLPPELNCNVSKP